MDSCRRGARPQGNTVRVHHRARISDRVAASNLSRQAVDVRGNFKMRINYGFNRLRFVSPVPAGARIRARFSPLKVTENEVTWQVTVEVEGQEKPALVAEWWAILLSPA